MNEKKQIDARLLLNILYERIKYLERHRDENAGVLREEVGAIADKLYPVDCKLCGYGAEGGRNTICCQYCGPDEARPFGYCQVFEEEADDGTPCGNPTQRERGANAQAQRGDVDAHTS